MYLSEKFLILLIFQFCFINNVLSMTQKILHGNIETPEEYLQAVSFLEQQEFLTIRRVSSPTNKRDSAVYDPSSGSGIDIMATPNDYKGTLQGMILPEHDFPQTEGYAPPLGYYKQTSECDQFMTLWFNDCAFIDKKKSLYHMDPGKMFPPPPDGKKPRNPAEFIGEMLKDYNSKLFNREKCPPYEEKSECKTRTGNN